MLSVRVGVVEDNDVDFYALSRGLATEEPLARWISGEDLIRSLLHEHGMLARLDVLLLDLGLPGIHGLHVARTVRRTPGGERVKIVVLTGAAPPQALVTEITPLVDEIRMKPRNRRQLAQLGLRLTELAA